MSHYRIDTSEITWKDAGPGLKVADMETGLGMVRLAVFAAGFRDDEWCTHGHLGYVLAGEAEVAFESGDSISFQPGDVIVIPEGTKHKTSTGRDECQIVFFRK